MSDPDKTLCRYAEKLTAEPASMTEGDIGLLRDSGFGDHAIHDAAQVIAYFNYINRIADGLGIDPEESVHEWEDRAP